MNYAKKLQDNSAAVRVSFKWLGTRKTLSSSQTAKAAEPFDADCRYLSAAQKLFDTRHPAYRKLTSIKNEIVGLWKSMTLPYVEDGIRLIAKDDISVLNDKMGERRTDLHQAVAELDQQFWQIRADAQKRLGSLYNPDNYPQSVVGTMDVEWDFPSVDPPAYLAQISPQLYQQEQERIAARFEEAVGLAEAAFLKELQELTATLHERLTPGPDGTKKVFRDSSVENLNEFFQRFKKLNIGNNAELDAVVAQAQQFMQGIVPEDLRNLTTLRQEVASGLTGIKDKLDSLIVAAPRRKIIRPCLANGVKNGIPHNS